MSAIIIDGGLVHYEAFGRGRPVLFLHGWLGSWRYWVPTMEALSDQYRTYALDLWGFGDSDKSRPRYRLADYVALVENFVETVGIRDVTLIGHALGAVIGLKYAVCYPERVNRIAAVSLPIYSDCINRRLLDANHNSVMAKLMWRRQQIGYREVQKEAEKTHGQAIHDSLQSIAQINVLSHVQTIDRRAQPKLLLIYGEKDGVIDSGPARSLDSHWSNARVIGLPEAKHFPMLDEAAKFQRLLKDFLGTENDLSVLEVKELWRRRTR